MGRQATKRLTGFSIKVDGNPDAVERLYRALISEWGQLIEDATAKRDRDALLVLRPVYLRPVNPVHGTLSLRR